MITRNLSPDNVNRPTGPLVTDERELIRLALRMARRFGKPAHHDAAGYEEAALVAVIRAMENWDPARGASLAGYTGYLVEKALLREYRRQKPPAGISVCSLDLPVGDGDARLEELLASDEPNPADTVTATDEEQALFNAVHAALADLPERHRELLLGLFWLELPLPQAARRINMPLPVARRIERLSLSSIERSLVGRSDLSFAL